MWMSSLVSGQVLELGKGTEVQVEVKAAEDGVWTFADEMLQSIQMPSRQRACISVTWITDS